jgi:hypothetical protein
MKHSAPTGRARRVFYDPNGAAITPGNFLFGTNGGTVRQKPDMRLLMA